MPKQKKLNLTTLPLSKINPADYNPRKDLTPDDPEYQKIKNSVLEFDIVEPMVVNKRGNVLVSGHQRLKVMKELGYKEAQVSMVDLPKGKEKALNVALNKIRGEWDFPKLKDLLQDIDTGEFDTGLTGFDEGELEALFAPIVEPSDDFFEDSGGKEKLPKTITCPECGHKFDV